MRFFVLTYDGKIFICVRAQDNGKAIHTPQDNSMLGKYFRERLNVPHGSFVHKEDLDRYGRTTVDIFKIDVENYYLDFSCSATQSVG